MRILAIITLVLTTACVSQLQTETLFMELLDSYDVPGLLSNDEDYGDFVFLRSISSYSVSDRKTYFLIEDEFGKSYATKYFELNYIAPSFDRRVVNSVYLPGFSNIYDNNNHPPGVSELSDDDLEIEVLPDGVIFTKGKSKQLVKEVPVVKIDKLGQVKLNSRIYIENSVHFEFVSNATILDGKIPMKLISPNGIERLKSYFSSGIAYEEYQGWLIKLSQIDLNRDPNLNPVQVELFMRDYFDYLNLRNSYKSIEIFK